jgi:glycosyltransferase involved in cell wall biosynthesis
MKVLFDTQIYDWQINGGISRYFAELIQRLDAKPDVDVLFNCAHSYNTYIQDTKWLKSSPYLKGIDFKGKLRIVKKVNQVINRPWSNSVLKTGEQDLFHPTYYDPYFLEYIGSRPFVLTVHDLTNEKFNDNSALTQKVLSWKKQLILKADHIISISNNTKKDIIDYYQVSADKISMIPLAGGLNFANDQPSLQADPHHKDYLLFVGSRGSYKNFNGSVAEIAPLLSKHNLQLIVAGGGAFNAGEIAMLKKFNIYDRVRAYAHVTDRHLAQLYTNALVFIFPSKYEGFGIPVLEAMQCGCPALLSNNSSLPEVGGDAAQYFDPLTKGDLNSALNSLILDEALRRQMKSTGLQQSKKFNWQNTADKHEIVYRSILAHHKPV